MWPGQKLSLALEGFSTDAVLYNEESEFQSILVFRSAQHGNVLALDGVIRKLSRFIRQRVCSEMHWHLISQLHYYESSSYISQLFLNNICRTYRG